MAQQRILRAPGGLLKGASDQDSRAKENRRFQQGSVVGLDLIARTARVSVGYFNKNGTEVYLEAVPYPAQLNPAIGDIVSLDYPHTSPGSVRITTTGLAGSNGTGTVKTVPHNLLDGSIDQDTVAGSPSKGDLIVGNGSSPSLWTTFSPGSDGTVLIADSAQTNGLRWGGAPASHPLLDGSVDNDTDAHTPAAGDMIYAHGSPVKWDGLAFGSNGQVLRGVSGAPAWSNDDKTVVIAIDGGGSAIVAPWQSAPIYLPYGLTLTSVEIGADQSGSCQFDVWYSVSGVPTSSNSIVASDPPKLNSQQTSSDSALTGWTTSLAAGGWMIVKLSSASVVTKLVMVLAGKHS